MRIIDWSSDVCSSDLLGFQVDSDAELAALRVQAEHADLAAVDEPGAACCYARSDKHWIEDPQGIAWETFHTLGDIPMFGEPVARTASSTTVCCAPEPAAAPAKIGRASGRGRVWQYV